MNIRKAELRDIEEIDKLLYQVAEIHSNARPDLFKPNSKKYTDEELENIIDSDDAVIFVAEENNKILGYAFCLFKNCSGSNILKNIKTLYIDDLCVDENIRGRHIGKSLYNHTADYAKSRGFYNITLNVWGCNKSAFDFYESLGMSIQKTTMEKIL
ncbi:MAG: GNAT family N-acetyltransferase [Clostridiales bacterium]|nr:GNAT family N-acetyltransferase [Clostridiales bacterium]